MEKIWQLMGLGFSMLGGKLRVSSFSFSPVLLVVCWVLLTLVLDISSLLLIVGLFCCGCFLYKRVLADFVIAYLLTLFWPSFGCLWLFLFYFALHLTAIFLCIVSGFSSCHPGQQETFN